MSAPLRALAFALSALLVSGGIVSATTTAHAAENAKIRGYVTDSAGRAAKTVTVRLFRSDANDKNWTYVRAVNVRASGVYEVKTNGPGRYHLQLVDRRPAYNLKSYARIPNIDVNVGTSAVFRNVRVQTGGAIGGTVRVKSRSRYKGAGYAKVRAIGNDGQVYEVQSDKRGQFALGGLPKGSYRVFAYDRANRRVGTSKLVRNVKLRSFRKVSFKLRTRPSAYRGFLTVGNGNTLARGGVTVTAVNQRTGEYWVRRISGGGLSLTGLTAGSYKLTIPDTNGHFGRVVTLPSVRPGQTRSISVNLPVRGGTISGTVVDAVSHKPIPNISVRLVDAQGKTQQELPAKADGRFTLGGTIRPRSGMTVMIFAYDRIGEHYYTARTFSGLSISNNTVLNLNTIADDGGAYIELQRDDPAPTPTPTTPAPSASTPTTPAPTTTTPAPAR